MKCCPHVGTYILFLVVDTIYALLSGNMPGYDSGFRHRPKRPQCLKTYSGKVGEIW